MGSRSIILFSILVLFLLLTGCEQQYPGTNTLEPDTTQATQDQLGDDRLQPLPEESTLSSTSSGTSIGPGLDSTVYASRHNAITQAVQKVSPAVVSITVTEVRQIRRRQSFDEFYDRFFYGPIEREFSSMGSGFIISEDGLVVTNEHVASRNAQRIVISLPDGSQYEANVVGTDELADLALLQIQADRKFPYMRFGDSDQIMVGEWSVAIGNPFGLFQAAQPSVTVGVVSALHRDFRPNPNEPRVYMDMIQTDAAINRGNSGGPLVNSAGEVIGVNTFIYTGGTSGGFVGLGFAIPSNRVQKIIEQLSSSGGVQMTYDPGFETTEMTYQLAAKYNLPVVMGLLVVSVNRDGPAFESGIIPGDIIIRVGDERVQSKMHMQALFREYNAGDTMRVGILRNSKPYEAQMALRERVAEED